MKAPYRQALSLSRRFHSLSLRHPSLSPQSAVPLLQYYYRNRQWLSTSPLQSAYDTAEDDSKGPVGDLFQFPEIGSSNIVGKTGSIRRSFGPQSNAEAMITCGGEALAAQASFDPNYLRAKDWIRSHPVGPAVLSPVLISGFVGALVEAAFPKAIAIGSQMQFLRPLIVGVEVRAKIEVVAVANTGASSMQSDNQQHQQDTENENDHRQLNDVRKRKNGYQVDLRTNVLRINDGVIIAEGNHSIWIPDYLHM
jgi:acyl dehydratase